MPTTEFLLTHQDGETQSPYYDFTGSEEFLGSHVLRITPESPPQTSSKDATSLRESKGKARQYTTVNGRGLIVRDAYVYTNKGFKTSSHAQLLNDAIYFAGGAEVSQWLIYYISRPLLGDPEALTTGLEDVASQSFGVKSAAAGVKGPLESFSKLLASFPNIARQVQPEFNKHLQACEQQLLALSLKSSRADQNLEASFESPNLTAENGKPSHVHSMAPETYATRAAVEMLVNSCIHHFQTIDRHSLSFLQTAVDLADGQIDGLIERYVLQQLHNNHLFPRICAFHKTKDAQLETNLRHVADIDDTQVGLTVVDIHDRREISLRVANAILIFSKMKDIESPLDMLSVLLETEHSLGSAVKGSDTIVAGAANHQEKGLPPSAMNADTLVSLLLLIVIRSPVRQLFARLCYMRDFVFSSDVENGETGYALSTFEAVLVYLSSSSSGLKIASRLNRNLWQAVKISDIKTIRSSLEAEYTVAGQDEFAVEDHDHFTDPSLQPDGDHPIAVEIKELMRNKTIENGDYGSKSRSQPGLAHVYPFMDTGEMNPTPLRGSQSSYTTPPQSNLAHVFPFVLQPCLNTGSLPGKVKKRVSMQARSLSNSSTQSWTSFASSLHSLEVSGEETTPAHLSQTRDRDGNSLLMMAIKYCQPEAFMYLLQIPHYFPLAKVLEDQDAESTTLLSAALQLGNFRILNHFVRFIAQHLEDQSEFRTYLGKQDVRKRTAAHYLFNAPHLIGLLEDIPWRTRDLNGQTPLLALCRSYDHEDYQSMVATALSAASLTQCDGGPLHLDDHVDNKGNTLLHVVNDSKIIQQLLTTCDTNPNAMNAKHFTPLMIASKFARTDLVRILFNDARVDLQARDLRGLTTVELAKDDEVRNRIDDMYLLATPPAPDGRSTAIVRAFFVEDASVRFVIKSGAPNSRSSITVNTCRRTLADFENLARWLALENPASWLPVIHSFRTPFQISSKPSRAVLRDTQLRLHSFLSTMLEHPTFATHEMLWEFILVPDINPDMLAERAQRKAVIRVEKLREDYEPITDGGRTTRAFMDHAQNQVVKVHDAISRVFHNLNLQRNIFNELADGVHVLSTSLPRSQNLPSSHKTALSCFHEALYEQEFGAHAQFLYVLTSSLSASSAVLRALTRPSHLIGSINACADILEMNAAASRRPQRWPLGIGLLDDARQRSQQESSEKARKAELEMQSLGRELAYTQQVIAGELAGWQEWHTRTFRRGLKDLAKKMVVQEKARLDGMKRALRQIEKARHSQSSCQHPVL